MYLGALKGPRAAAAILVSALLLGGCRTDSDDVHRWGTTNQGPRKLVAVLTHAKYPVNLRVEAALTLVGMRPRSGRRVGLQGGEESPGLVEALSSLPPDDRKALVERLGPKLLEEMRKKPASGTPDASVPYKDAAFALLTSDSGSLLAGTNLKPRIRDALTAWIAADFQGRLDDPSALYAIEQMVRELKADGVRPLARLIEPKAGKIDRLAELIADYGDAETKLEASRRLVEVAKGVDSPAWLKEREPAVRAANRASKLNPAPEQFRQQLLQYQDEELSRVFTSMKKVGKKPVVDYLLGLAKDQKESEKHRASAMAALRGNLDRDNATHAEVVLSLVEAEETSDKLRDVALACAAEFPRSTVADRLYGTFKSPDWRVRWVAAELLLRMSRTGDLEEFLGKLAEVKTMSITEPLRYGALISQMKGSRPARTVVDQVLESRRSVPARLSALGYYYEVGTRADLDKVRRFEDDRSRVPSCPEEPKGCEWKCLVGSGKERQTREVTSVGEFVSYCVEPKMEARVGGA